MDDEEEKWFGRKKKKKRMRILLNTRVDEEEEEERITIGGKDHVLSFADDCEWNYGVKFHQSFAPQSSPPQSSSKNVEEKGDDETYHNLLLKNVNDWVAKKEEEQEKERQKQRERGRVFANILFRSTEPGPLIVVFEYLTYIESLRLCGISKGCQPAYTWALISRDVRTLTGRDVDLISDDPYIWKVMYEKNRNDINMAVILMNGVIANGNWLKVMNCSIVNTIDGQEKQVWDDFLYNLRHYRKSFSEKKYQAAIKKELFISNCSKLRYSTKEETIRAITLRLFMVSTKKVDELAAARRILFNYIISYDLYYGERRDGRTERERCFKDIFRYFSIEYGNGLLVYARRIQLRLKIFENKEKIERFHRWILKQYFIISDIAMGGTLDDAKMEILREINLWKLHVPSSGNSMD
ncbi:MAG: hypothetical protein ACTSUE_20410 [Promethearchaeota archaeon]